MDASDQVIVVLKVLLHVGPVAVYFVALGLVNSQATPTIVSARSDFLALTVVFCPLLLWPVPALVHAGMLWAVVAGIALIAPLFVAFLYGLNGDWVVYNISDHRARRLLDRAVRELGWQGQWNGDEMRVDPSGLAVRLSTLPLLRNVTMHIAGGGAAHAGAIASLRERFSALLATQQLLPSPAGSCLLMLGIGLLMLPLWMMSRHSEAIAGVVTRWLVM